MGEKLKLIHEDLVINGTTVEGVRNKYITKIVIPEGIEHIGYRAFSNLYALENIEFPSSLITIGDYAFSKCSSIKNIVLPDRISELGMGVFEECQQLETVDLSKTKIQIISEGTFRECRKLDHILFGSSLREIEKSVFTNCQSLKVLELPEGTMGVNDSFVGCVFDSISIPSSLKYIETLSRRKVKSITVSEEQFERFQLVLPKKTEINYDIIFSIRCPLCGAIYTECKCPNRCSRIEVEGTVLKKAMVWGEEFVVPEHITVIEKRAFYWNEDIKRITLPISIVEIGEEAFADCRNLEYINLHRLVNLRTIGDSAFKFCKKLCLEESSFSSLSKLNRIGHCAFMETAIETLDFANVENVGTSAFAGCSKLERVSFYKCETTLGTDVFSECDALEDVFLPENITEVPNGMFNNCKNLCEIFIPKKVTKIGDYAFLGCSSLSKVMMVGDVVSLGKCAFAYCDSLGQDFQFEFLIWDSLEIIGESAFSGCSGLTHIEIPERVKYIGKNAFSTCYYIRYFFIPKSVMTIESGAFVDFPHYGCKFDIELPYQPRGWNVKLIDDRFSGITVNWGYVKD